MFVILSLFLNIIGAELVVPPLKSYVNDEASILGKKDLMYIDALLRDFDNKTGKQIFVLIIPSLQGEDIADYSMRVVEKWKPGKKEEDNGVLLLVSLNDRKLRIEVGYGLEGVLTDLSTSRIINEYIVPWFKKEQYALGIMYGVVAIIHRVAPEYKFSKHQDYEKKKSSKLGLLIQFIVILLFILFSPRGGFLFFLLGLGGSRGRDDYFGGFGGGSFGGGSGGSFGGGGASGSW